MPEPNPTLKYSNTSLAQALIISLSLALVALLAACPLTAIAVQQRVLAPPAFTIRLGHVEFAAPCPSRGFVCDRDTPFYAVWRGDDQPDGSVNYQELFFMYLRPARQR